MLAFGEGPSQAIPTHFDFANISFAIEKPINDHLAERKRVIFGECSICMWLVRPQHSVFRLAGYASGSPCRINMLVVHRYRHADVQVLRTGAMQEG